MKNNQCNRISTRCLTLICTLICTCFFSVEATYAQYTGAGPRPSFGAPVETYSGDRFYNERRTLPFVQNEEYLRRDSRSLGQGLEDRISQARLYGWQFVPHITLEETYSDNVALAPPGLEEDDFITVVTPGISLRNFTNRFAWAIDYSLQNIFYADNSDANESFHLLNLDTLSEIVDDHLFLDFTLNHSPRNISNIGTITLDNLSISEDRSNVLTYRVNPYWQQRLGNFSDVTVGYATDEVSGDAGLRSSTSDEYYLNVASGPAFTRFLWDIRFSHREVEHENATFAEDVEFRTVLGEMRYLLTNHFALLGAVGYDDNDFASAGDVSGVRWNVGAAWQPSARTSIEGTIGERFFGTDVFFELTHWTRSTRWNARYTQTPTTTRTFLFEQQVFNLFDQFGEPIINPNTGDPATLLVDIPVQTTEVLIRERFSAAFQYELRRNIFNINGYIENRDFELTNRSQDATGINGSWVWTIGPKTRSQLNLSRIEHDSDTGFSNEYYIAQYELVRLLGPTLEASVGARYLTRDSTVPASDFDETRIFVKLYKTF